MACAGGREHFFTFGDRAVVAEQQGCEAGAVGRSEQRRVGLGLVGQGRAEVTVVAKQGGGLIERVEQHAPKNFRDRVQAVFKRGHSAEIAAATTQRPEQVGVIGGAGGTELAVGRHNIGGEQVVNGQAVLAHEPTEAATESEAGDAGVGDHAAGCGKAEWPGFMVEIGPEHAALRAHGAADGIDLNALHARHVNDDAAVVGAVAGGTMAASSQRDEQPVGADEIDGTPHVGRTRAAQDHCGAAVDVAVPHAACGVVGGAVGEDEFAAHGAAEGVECVGSQHGGAAVQGLECDGHGLSPD